MLFLLSLVFSLTPGDEVVEAGGGGLGLEYCTLEGEQVQVQARIARDSLEDVQSQSGSHRRYLCLGEVQAK